MHYVFQGNEPIFEKRISDGRIRNYIYAMGMYLTRADGVIGNAPTVYYYQTDFQGSIKAVIPGGTEIFRSKSSVKDLLIYGFKAEVRALITQGKGVSFLSFLEGLAGDATSAHERKIGGPSLSQAADMADHVYSGEVGDIVSGGWELIAIKTNENDGGSCRIGIYARMGAYGKEYAFVNAGTTPSDLVDWKNNLQQPFGASKDMKFSVAQAKMFVKANSNSSITFIGHSKGGAEATVNAVATNRHGIVFNPATPFPDVYGVDTSKFTNTVNAFIVRGEILNNIFGPAFLLTKPNGRIIYLPRQSLLDPIYNHSMAAVKQGIIQWQER